MFKAVCPSCTAQVNLGPKPKMGQHIFCLECDNELQIVSLDPLELDWPFDDDDDDDDEIDI